MKKNSVTEHMETFKSLLGKTGFADQKGPIDPDSWIGSVVASLSALKKKGGKVFLIGNGASCSMASHFAADLTKNAGISSYSINEGSLLTCFANDFSFETAYMEILKRLMRDGDILIAISSSGKSQNIVNAASFAAKEFKNSSVITFTGFKKDNPLMKIGNFNVHVPIEDYGYVESAHAYFLHMLEDLFIRDEKA